MRKFFNKLTTIAFFGLFMSGHAQQIAGDFNSYIKEYPDTHMVTLNQEINLDLKLNKGVLEITKETFEENLYLSESAVHNSKKALSFSSFFELDKIEASSFIPKDGKYKKIKVEKFFEKDDRERHFYDDLKTLNFIYPDLQKGAISQLKYSETIKNPRFLSPFYFGDFVPIINTQFKIVADKDITLSFKEFNTDGLDIKFKKTSKGKNNIYTWTLLRSEQIKIEGNVQTYKKIIPHIVPIINSYQANGNTITILDGVSSLYSWYQSMVGGINKKADDPSLVRLVEELTANKKTDLEKVKALYYWTQKNIKYIDREYALGGFIPREANTVFQRKYGDCKDNTSILQKMLSIAGIESYYTWIGTRDIPYSYEELPTPMVDNHMILAYQNQGKTYFLDATGRYLPLGLPSSFIQGKEALIGISDIDYQVETVPEVAAEQNAIIEQNYLEINNNKLLGSCTTEISGYPKVDFFHYLEEINNEDDIKEFYNIQFRKGNNKFLIQNLEEQHKFEYDKNLVVDYAFTIENYIKNLGDEIYINLNLTKDIIGQKTKDDRKYNIDTKYKKHFKTSSTLKIPDGYKVSYIPKDVIFKNDKLSISIKYSLEEQGLVYTNSVIQNSLSLSPEEQKETNNLIEQAEKAYKEMVILKKI